MTGTLVSNIIHISNKGHKNNHYHFSSICNHSGNCCQSKKDRDAGHKFLNNKNSDAPIIDAKLFLLGV